MNTVIKYLHAAAASAALTFFACTRTELPAPPPSKPETNDVTKPRQFEPTPPRKLSFPFGILEATSPASEQVQPLLRVLECDPISNNQQYCAPLHPNHANLPPGLVITHGAFTSNSLNLVWAKTSEGMVLESLDVVQIVKTCNEMLSAYNGALHYLQQELDGEVKTAAAFGSLSCDDYKNDRAGYLTRVDDLGVYLTTTTVNGDLLVVIRYKDFAVERRRR